MTYKNMSVKEQIEVALSTSDMQDMMNLIKSPYMLVRRALARNMNTPAQLINRLCMDPVLNVSYLAAQNSKSSVIRNFDGQKLSPCVTCKNVENKLKCTSGCGRKEDHSF